MDISTNPGKNRIRVILSPFLIILVNYIVARISGNIVGKWAFIPIILIEWCLFLFFVLKFGGRDSIKKWLKRPSGNFGWPVLALVTGLIPLPIFLKHFDLLMPWNIWLPWILLAMINPWIEEFYWRGLLLDYTGTWNKWMSILFTSFVFAANHAVFGVNSVLLSGPEVFISTFIMGILWALIFKNTASLRWVIAAHFLVDFFNLSVPSFLDLYIPGW
jgi:membrane protease YdiL (CAAX protease family)